ncbi:MAG: SEC-C metal-binding domain-containing protein [Pseudonocardiaceae bacterium]
MLSTGLLTADDIDEIGRVAFDADQPLDLAAELVSAVDHDLVADPFDTADALMLAAEITERGGDLPAALVLTERALESHDDQDGYPRAFRAGLLLRLGREDEAMAELIALRPLLSHDPNAVVYICLALEAGGRLDVAEQWLTAALPTALQHRQELESQRGTPESTQAAAVAFLLAQARHQIRSDLDLPHDDYDYLADRLLSAVQAALGPDEPDYAAAMLLFWPQPEFDRLLLRWPALADQYGTTWDDHRTMMQKMLVLWSESSQLRLGLVAGAVEELAAHAERNGDDPIDPQVRQDYAQDLTEPTREIAWPPGRNDSCWCGSPQKYKKCCLPRART